MEEHRLKKYSAVFLIAMIMMTLLIPKHEVYAKPGVSAHNAVLMEMESGRVLYDKNAHQQRNIASITKILTAIVAIESGKLEEMAVASKKAVYTEGSSIYLEQGEKMKLKDLVYGLMLRSGNDSAIAIAEHVGGSEEGFVHLMNETAEWIGMTNSSFSNPHGLDGEGHYSTAYDMALLMRYAMQNDQFREVAKTVTYKAETRKYAWRNKNKLLTRYYDYCIGGKTGFTSKARRTLVNAAAKDGMELIVVTLNAPDDWNDHQNLFNWGFKNFNMTKVEEKGEIFFESNNGHILHDILVPLTNGEKEKIKETTYLLKEWEKQPNKQAVIGKNIYTLNGEIIAEASIVNNVEIPEHTLFDAFKALLRQMFGASKW